MRYHAKFHQNRSNGCRDGDLAVSEMAADRHLGFSKLEFLTVGTVNRLILHRDVARPGLGG